MSKRRSFSILLAVVLIGAVGLTIALLGRHFVGMTHSVRLAELDIHAAQLLASGRAWVSAHKSECAALSPGQSVSLPTEDLVPRGVDAELMITLSAEGDSFVGTSSVSAGRFKSRFEVTFSSIQYRQPRV